jgi:uncharacterized membrane protein YidH (DUF202 family)
MAAPPGLQRERTMLAWERTVLSTLVAALALGRVWLSWSLPAALVSAVLAGAAALAALRRRRVVAVGSATAWWSSA